MNKSEENSILGLDSTKSSLSRSGITSDISASFMPLRRSELQQELQFSDLEEEQNEKIATKENQQNELNTRVSTININIIPPIEDVVKTPARKDITTWSSVNSYNNIAQTTPQSSSRNMGNFVSQSVNRFKTPQTIMSTPHTVRNSVGKDRASVNSSSESVNIHSTDSSVSKAYTCKTPTFKMWQTNPVSQTSVTKSIMKPSPLQRAITFTNNLKKIPFQNLKRADSEPKEVKLPVPGQSKKADSKPEEVNLPVPGQSTKADSKPKELNLQVNTRSVLFGQSSASFESYCKTYKDRKAHDLLPYNHLIDSAVRLDLNDTGFGLIENTEQIGDVSGPKYDVMGENKKTPTKAISDRQSVELNRISITSAEPVVQKPPNDKIVYCSQPVTLSLTTTTETVVPKPESVKKEANIVKYHLPLNIKAVVLKSEPDLNIINSNNLSNSPQMIVTNSVADDKFLDAMFSGKATQQCGNFKTPNSILSKDNSLDNKENGVCPVPSNINRSESTQQCGNFKTLNSILSKDNSLDNKENGVCQVPSNINRSESTQQCGNFKKSNSILSKDNSLDNKENGVCPVPSNINRAESNSTPLNNINSNHFQSQQNLKSSSDNKLSDSSGSESVTQDLVNFKMPKSVISSQEKDHVNKEKGLCPVQVNSSGMRTLTIGSNSYIIQRKLGEGGSSVVHLTLQSDNRKPRAVKVVNMAVGEALAKGYLNEVKLLSKLQGSDRVVKMYDYVHSPSHKVLYMVMECGDSDLNQIIKKSQAAENKYLPIVTLVDYWLQMLEAVQYIHNNGVIHSDLKPANFLCVKGRLKLIDFGIASSINNDMTSVNVYVQAGTFNYMSPEALQDASGPNSPLIENQYKCKISYKSDVWSLGCILYLLLYGCTPFGHINRIFLKVAAITDPVLKIKYGDLPFYPPILVQTVKKCLVHDPKARPSVTELLELPRAPFSCPHRMP